MMREVLRDESDLEEACRVLVDAANERGGPDNITVVLVRVEP
jgi:serine/threonine protein phosphatase PrpC